MTKDEPAGRSIKRLGFIAGKITVPDDFDRMGSEEIEAAFGAWPETALTRPSGNKLLPPKGSD